MAIYLTKDMRIVVQGITGTVGSIQTKLALSYGTNIVAGVSPNKRGQQIYGVPVYNTVKEAVIEQNANAALIFVPAAHAPNAAHAALDAGVKLMVIITEHIPIRESLLIKLHASETGAVVIGPNCPGLLSPGIGNMGIIPSKVSMPGRIGVVSRSGTLCFEITHNLTVAGIGQSTIVGIGGDAEPCTSFTDVLSSFEADPCTDAVVLIGEIGGSLEEQVSLYIKRFMNKPVFAYIAGRMAPPGKKMGHAGAIVRGSTGTVKSKVDALQQAGVYVAYSPMEIPEMILEKCKNIQAK
jgi:succinyl-CoA synthetase alpha subunit